MSPLPVVAELAKRVEQRDHDKDNDDDDDDDDDDRDDVIMT